MHLNAIFCLCCSPLKRAKNPIFYCCFPCTTSEGGIRFMSVKGIKSQEKNQVALRKYRLQFVLWFYGCQTRFLRPFLLATAVKEMGVFGPRPLHTFFKRCAVMFEVHHIRTTSRVTLYKFHPRGPIMWINFQNKKLKFQNFDYIFSGVLLKIRRTGNTS